VSFEGIVGDPVKVPARGAGLQAGVPVTLGIRPEQMIADGPGEAAAKARVEFVEHLGGTSFAYAPSFPAGALIAAADPRRGTLHEIEPHLFRFHGADCLLFSEEGQRVR
jgi:ABC-type sugar transport system ATPase subunit